MRVLGSGVVPLPDISEARVSSAACGAREDAMRAPRPGQPKMLIRSTGAQRQEGAAMLCCYGINASGCCDAGMLLADFLTGPQRLDGRMPMLLQGCIDPFHDHVMHLAVARERDLA